MKKIITSGFLLLTSLGWVHASTTLREELQRYIGYENLPMRYITIVYDVLMGNNITIDSYDVGFLYFTLFFFLTHAFSLCLCARVIYRMSQVKS